MERSARRCDEEPLFRRVRRFRDEEAREDLVRRYLPLARHTARRFAAGHEPLDDLVQVASLGLLKAIDRFDPGRGVAFTSYAVPTMTGELKRHARDTGWGVHVPRGLQERALEVERVIDRLNARDGCSPTPGRIGAETGLSPEEVLEAIDASAQRRPDSVDLPVGDDGDSGRRIDRIGSGDPRYELLDALVTLAPAVRALPRRERTILELRFGHELSQSQIARRLGLSQMHVSRLLRRTLDQLAHACEPELAVDPASDTGGGSSAF